MTRKDKIAFLVLKGWVIYTWGTATPSRIKEWWLDSAVQYINVDYEDSQGFVLLMLPGEYPAGYANNESDYYSVENAYRAECQF